MPIQKILKILMHLRQKLTNLLKRRLERMLPQLVLILNLLLQLRISIRILRIHYIHLIQKDLHNFYQLLHTQVKVFIVFGYFEIGLHQVTQVVVEIIVF